MDRTKQPGVQIERVFVERVHFEHGEEARRVPFGTPVPELQFNIQFEARRLQDSANRVAGRLLLATPKKESFFYHVEVELVAVVSSIAGQENMPVEEYAAGPLISALYPFAREVVASVTGRGRHGPAYLKPLNVQAAMQAAPAEAAPTRRSPRKRPPSARKR